MHLHIAGVLVFDASSVDGGVGFRQIRDHVADRVPLVPPFRQPDGRGALRPPAPLWSTTPTSTSTSTCAGPALPRPGGPAELAALVADLAERPLDRSRPLWEIHVVEGLEHGHVALVPKVHHSIIDGVSGAEVMAAFFDLDAGAGAAGRAPAVADVRTGPSLVAGPGPR